MDWLDATGKQYKKYESAFNNCCRSEWYKDRPGSSKSDQIKSNDILIACPDGHYSRKVSKGVRGVCPKCHEQLLPNEEIQLKRAMAWIFLKQSYLVTIQIQPDCQKFIQTKLPQLETSMLMDWCLFVINVRLSGNVLSLAEKIRILIITTIFQP